MNNYIATYFYNDSEDLGAIYGNISLDLYERNIIYWQTVYTLYLSAYLNNRCEDINYILFTNIQNFPFRAEIESLGVIIHDNLLLTHRGNKKWATVKFFFDVLNYIEISNHFKYGDKFVLLDTDVLAQHNSKEIFDFLNLNKRPLTFINAHNVNKSDILHGLTISRLEEICLNVFNVTGSINASIGGEFFGFKKGYIDDVLLIFDKLLGSKYSDELSTEEQILTITNSLIVFSQFPYAICRIWSSLSFIKIPKNIERFIWLHLPSEKEDGLNVLFNRFKSVPANKLDGSNFTKILFEVIPLKSRRYLFFKKIINKVKNYMRLRLF